MKMYPKALSEIVERPITVEEAEQYKAIAKEEIEKAGFVFEQGDFGQCYGVDSVVEKIAAQAACERAMERFNETSEGE